VIVGEIEVHVDVEYERLFIFAQDRDASSLRVLAAPLQAVALAELEDRDYVTNELAAFAPSWLRALSATVINEPNPHGLAGRWRPPLEWRVLASLAGMPTAALRIASDDGADPQSVGLDEPSSPSPDLSLAGEPGVAALEQALST
jgi:hypothetical protein